MNWHTTDLDIFAESAMTSLHYMQHTADMCVNKNIYASNVANASSKNAILKHTWEITVQQKWVMKLENIIV